MEIDPPHESDGSSTGSKENGIYPVVDNLSGQGLPYAPEDFPNPGDKWGWKVGKRVGVLGYFVDRYLYLPARLQKQYKTGGFASKASVGRFIAGTFPDVDINAFFASFNWKIPSAKFKGYKASVSAHTHYNSQFDAAGCKAGNIMCPSLLETSEPPPSDVRACDICCIAPRFCRECCCILCSRPVNSANGDHSIIRCEAVVEEGFICGHIAHIECSLRSYMAGTVGGSIGLDAEYYCRRCDFKTDLVPLAMNLFQSCDSIPSDEKIKTTLNICLLILRGSVKPGAKTLLHQVESAMAKLKGENALEDTWKREFTSADTTGELCESETDVVEVSNFKEPFPSETESPQVSFANLDYRVESLQLENRIEQTLLALKKSQQVEYRLAKDILSAQKNYLLNLYQELDREKRELAKHPPSADQSLTNVVIERVAQIKRECAKLSAMEAVGKGFGKTSKIILKEHFGVKTDD